MSGGDDEVGFETVDWGAVQSGRRRLSGPVVVFVLQALALGAWFAWDYTTVDEFGYTVAELGWTATALDWLTLFALSILVSFGLLPALARPDRVRALWKRYPRDVVSVSSLVVVAVVFVVGAVGPEFVARPAFNFELRTQPPVGFAVRDTWTDDCIRRVGEDRCAGTWRAPLGTTEAGHDIAAWLVYGARTTVQFVLIAVALVTPIAVGIGAVAGYVGGRYDAVLSQVIEIQRTVPTFIVYFLAAIFVGPTLFVLVLVYGLFDWADAAALVRSEARSVRERGYVRAARSAGATRLDVLRRHVVPNVAGAVLTSVTTLVPKLILVEALLSFLALSGGDSRSWGGLVFRGIGPQGNQVAMGVGQEILKFDSLWWIATLPTVAIALTVLATSLVGDALRDAVDTRT